MSIVRIWIFCYLLPKRVTQIYRRCALGSFAFSLDGSPFKEVVSKWPIMPRTGTRNRVRVARQHPSLSDYSDSAERPWSLLEFSLEAIGGSAALEFVPPSRRIVVLAAQGVGVNVRRRPNRRMPEPFGDHWQRHAVGH